MKQSGGNTSFSTFGGVFGNAGPYVADNTKTDGAVVVENCSNEADITLSGYMVSSGGPKMCFGGVVGAATAKLKNVVNKKSVTIKTQTKTMYAGGVAGYAAADMESCSNEGSVVLDGDKDNHPTSIGSEQAYFGGVVGYPIKGITMTSCLNKGAVTMQNIFTTNGALSYIGGVNGSYQGTIAMTDCENSGVVTNNALTPVCVGGISGAFNGTPPPLPVRSPRSVVSPVTPTQPSPMSKIAPRSLLQRKAASPAVSWVALAPPPIPSPGRVR